MKARPDIRMVADDEKKRSLRPREPIAIAPRFVSQLTSEAVLGISARRYLEMVVPLAKGNVVRVGNLRVLPLDVAERVLRELGSAADDDPRADVVSDVRQPETADDVLAALGRRRVGGAR